MVRNKLTDFANVNVIPAMLLFLILNFFYLESSLFYLKILLKYDGMTFDTELILDML